MDSNSGGGDPSPSVPDQCANDGGFFDIFERFFDHHLQRLAGSGATGAGTSQAAIDQVVFDVHDLNIPSVLLQQRELVEDQALNAVSHRVVLQILERDQKVTREAAERIGWPANGYSLFDYAIVPGENANKHHLASIESNCLITTREVWNDCGAYDERFDEPGAGNDIGIRAVDHHRCILGLAQVFVPVHQALYHPGGLEINEYGEVIGAVGSLEDAGDMRAVFGSLSGIGVAGIGDLLAMNVRDATDYFHAHPKIHRALQLLGSSAPEAVWLSVQSGAFQPLAGWVTVAR